MFNIFAAASSWLFNICLNVPVVKFITNAYAAYNI